MLQSSPLHNDDQVENANLAVQPQVTDAVIPAQNTVTPRQGNLRRRGLTL